MAFKLKRMATTLSVGIEDLVSKLENHEAVADSMLDDLKAGIAQIRVQQAQIESAAKRTTQQKEKVQGDANRWQERALQLAQTDEEKALQCIQRLEHSQEQIAALEQQLAAYDTTSAELSERIIELESNLTTLNLKRATLSAREVRAKSGKIANSSLPGTMSGKGAAQVFDRWEAAVITDEYDTQIDLVAHHGDTFEREFVAAENKQALKDKLAALKAQSVQDKADTTSTSNASSTTNKNNSS